MSRRSPVGLKACAYDRDLSIRLPFCCDCLLLPVSIAALNMLQPEHVAKKTRTVIESSSGSTVISMAIIARVLHAIDDTRALVTNKTSEAKLKLMRFFGLNL